MARIAGTLAGLMWVAGIALLVLAAIQLPTIDGVVFTSDVGAPAPGSSVYDGGGELVAGTVLVALAGVLTAGSLLARRRRR